MRVSSATPPVDDPPPLSSSTTFYSAYRTPCLRRHSRGLWRDGMVGSLARGAQGARDTRTGPNRGRRRPRHQGVSGRRPRAGPPPPLPILSGRRRHARRDHERRGSWRSRAMMIPDRLRPANDRRSGLLPPTWQLQPPDPTWRGKRFVSPDGTAWLATYATPVEQEPIAAHMKAVAFVDGEEVTIYAASATGSRSPASRAIASSIEGGAGLRRPRLATCRVRIRPRPNAAWIGSCAAPPTWSMPPPTRPATERCRRRDEAGARTSGMAGSPQRPRQNPVKHTERNRSQNV